MSKSFLLFWLSTAVASMGSFFTLVAIPWLTLELTDSALVLSSVMVCLSLPHSVFILFGGALTDIYKPLRILLLSRMLLLICLGILCLLIFTNNLSFWHLYPIGFLLGCSGSLAVTSAQAMPPFIVKAENLQVCNGILIGTNQASQIIGPMLAAWLIYFAQRYWVQSSSDTGILSVGYAILVDMFGILASILLVANIRLVQTFTAGKTNIIESFKNGMAWCFKDHAMCIVLCYLALASLLIHGPLAIILPLIAKTQFSNSVTDFGQLYSFLGIGALVGSLIAIKVKIPSDILIVAVIIGDFISGIMLFGIANTTSISIASTYIFCIGLSLGLISVSGVTWFQQRTPGKYMGRIMSLLLFAVFGLTPLSTAVSGFLIDSYSTNYLLQLSGSILICLAIAGLLTPKFRRVGSAPAQFTSTK